MSTLQTTTRAVSLHEARAMYIYRYTMEHVPTWAAVCAPTGLFYAPQYRTDEEWYERTTFPGEPEHMIGAGSRTHCFSSAPTWPLGQWLQEPYRVQRRAAA